MLKKKWLLREFDKNRVVEISKKFQISPLTAIILYNRGVRDDADITRFLSKDLGVMHDPYLLRDMEKAVARVRAAVENVRRNRSNLPRYSMIAPPVKAKTSGSR